MLQVLGHAPLVALLELAAVAGHKRIAMIGISCQFYALRVLRAELEFLIADVQDLRGLHQSPVCYHHGLDDARG
jgi:coenzyme F420-reducing hydrogenase beta subunit